MPSLRMRSCSRSEVYTVPGRGNFVADSAGLKEERKQELRGKLQGILREAAEMGIPREELLQDL